MVRKGVVIGVVAAVVVVAIVLGVFATGLLSLAPSRTGKVVRIESVPGSYIAPEGWKLGDPPVISDKYFNPSRVTINVGDTVEYVNRDEVAHTFTALTVPSGAQKFDSGLVEPGKSWRYTFTVPGEYRWYCTAHPHKGGILTVQP